MSARPLVALAVLMAGCGPDESSGARGTLFESSHTVTLRSFDGSARLEVSRQFRNETNEPRSLTRTISVPRGAVVTSLRLGRGAAPLTRAPLSTEEQVAADWERLTGAGDAAPSLANPTQAAPSLANPTQAAPSLANPTQSAPSLIGKLDWEYDDTLRLELFGLLPHETVTVEYDVSVEPDYSAGVLAFTYPPQDESEVTPRFERADVEATDEGFVVRRQHFTDSIADVRWATSPVDTNRTLWRLEVDVAPELAPLPIAPNVVFVLDASHSQGPDGIAAQLELLPPYLANTPDARVEVVVTRRFAERLFGAFVPVKEVPSLLERNAQRLEPGNGSNLDEGAALAARAVAEMSGPGRIVLFSDRRLRTTFSAETTRAALALTPRDTVVHLVDRAPPRGRELEVLRDDEDSLNALVEPSGGLLVRVVGAVSEGAAKELGGLVRPMRLDDVHVEAPGLEVIVDGELEQGATLRVHGVDARPPDVVTVSGMLWRREFRKVVGVDAFLAQRLPAVAVGEPELRLELSDDELRSVAFLSQAVSPVTGYLAAPPGAGPTPAGTVLGSQVSSTRCTGGLGSTSFSGCRLGIGKSVGALEAELARRLAEVRGTCEARLQTTSHAQVVVEVTSDEIVDVAVLRELPPMADCVSEGVWALRLGPEFRSVSRRLTLEFEAH